MNTNKIKYTKTESLPTLPILTSNKCTKVVTKHFTNASLYLPTGTSSLLYWLLYQSGTDNTFYYNTTTLRKYAKAVIESKKFYGTKNKLNCNLTVIRGNLQWLLKNGYIFWWIEGKMIINPMLTYYERISRKDFLEFSKRYQDVDFEGLNSFLADYVKLVRNKTVGIEK